MAEIKIENNNKYNVGDKVWWFDSWGNLRWGVIYEIKEYMAAIHENGRTGIQTGARLSECWPTKKDCIDADKRRSELRKDMYRKSIKDVRDLVQFMYTHDVSGEDCDYDAETVAKEKALELLGLELKLEI